MHGFFGEHRVDHLHVRLGLGDVLQRDVGRIGVLVVQHCVAMEEGAAASCPGR